MEYGLFIMPVHDPSKGLPRMIEEDMNTIVLADELGFHEAWIGEHHTIPWEPYPAPDLFIAKAIAKTKQIMLGTGVILLQLHDPKMLAQRIALLDHLCEGRFYFGIGTGGVATEFEYFDVPQEKRHARAAETIDAVLKIWASEGPVEYKGEFHQLTAPEPRLDGALRLWIKPATKPHPRIAVAGASPSSSTMEWAGENGWIPMSTEFLHPTKVPSHWEVYEKGAAKAGRKADRRDWRVAMDIHVAETTEQARHDVLNHGMGKTFDEYFLPLQRQVGGLVNVKPDDSDVPDDAIDVQWWLDNRWTVGDPEHCLRRIKEYYEYLGGFGTLLMLSQDWDPPEKGLKSLELFAKYIAPELRKLSIPPPS